MSMPKTKEQTLHISPDYIVGFVDGEGCFCISIAKHKTLRRKAEVRLLFEIELKEDDHAVLQAIQKTLGCGNIYRLEYQRYAQWKPHVKLKVSNIKDIVEHIIPFFDKHPLQAKKRKDYLLFRKVAFLIADKQHLTDNGFKKIQLLKESINV